MLMFGPAMAGRVLFPTGVRFALCSLYAFSSISDNIEAIVPRNRITVANLSPEFGVGKHKDLINTTYIRLHIFIMMKTQRWNLLLMYCNTPPPGCYNACRHPFHPPLQLH